MQTSRNPNPWQYAVRFALLTLVEGIIAFLGGLTWRLTMGWFTAYHPLSQMPWWWGRQVNDWCFRPINFNWEFNFTGEYRQDNRLKIVLFKHPPTILTWTVAYITGLYISRRIAFVLKGSHIFNPMGWGLWGLGLAIFAIRFHEWSLWKRWPQLQRKLHSFARWWFRYQVQRVVARAKRTPGGIAIVILPDQRYTPERFAEARRKFADTIPDLAEWEQQLPPRYLGTLELLSATRGSEVGVYWVNVALRADNAEGWRNFAPYINGQARATVYEITDALRFFARGGDLSRFDEDPTVLARWLNRFYASENASDRTWRRK